MSDEPTTTVQQAGPALTRLLRDWLPRQRWFAAKSDAGGVALRPVGGMRLADPTGRVGIDVHLVAVSAAPGGPATGPPAAGPPAAGPPAAGHGETVYQVPLTTRDAPEPALAHALLGTVDDADGTTRWVYDGPHDPAFVRALLRLLVDGGEAFCAAGPAYGTAHVVRPAGARGLDPDAPAAVLAGEQSNTSVVVGGDLPAIVKLFRVLSSGDNPDVVVQSALAGAGCERVARPVGWLEGTWPAPDGGRPLRGHLAYACEFLPGSEDAWRVACRAVDAGEDFTAPAGALGAATAQVHAALAATLPAAPATRRALDDLAASLLARVAWAVGEVPVLADRETAARLAVGAVRDADPAGLLLQQVHGDYHLGQVLHSPDRGWILLDFEGEPLRPLAERLAPDLALRDVAGMLRSFDYAARRTTLGLAPTDPRVAAADVWATACREAFLDGYGEVAGHDPRADGALLRALELDKALYEVVYETRNRPDWVGVPMHAVRRLLPLPGE